jgi:hypothetical protein
VIDMLLWAVVVPILFVGFLLTFGSAFADHLLVGWFAAVGFLGAGHPKSAFWAFAVWVAFVWWDNRRLIKLGARAAKRKLN